MIIENPTKEQRKTLKRIVYLITNTVNNKKYVGQTINTFYMRYRNKMENQSAILLKRAIKKYGQEKFKISILCHDVETQELLDSIEQFCINIIYNSKSPNGYNIQIGGSMDYINKSKPRKIYKIVSPSGNIYEIDNVQRFAVDNNIIPQNLNRVVNGKARSANGFYLYGTNILLSTKNSKIYKIKDKNGKIHEIYNLFKFSKENGVCYASLLRVVNKKQMTAMGFRLPETPIPYIPKIALPKYNPNQKYKSIILEKDGIEYIVDISKINDFVKNNKIKKRDIYTLTSEEQKTNHGFKLKQIILLTKEDKKS